MHVTSKILRWSTPAPLPICILALVFTLLCVPAQAEQRDEWISNLENPEWEIYKLKENNFKSKYTKFDYSAILAPRSEFLGYIGPNFSRLRIRFTTVKKESGTHDEYNVVGYSIVKDNQCDFEGVIKIIQIREYKKMHYGLDDEYKDRGIQAEGVLLGKYMFNEKEGQKYSGIFEGIMTLYWYADNNGHIKYDDIQSYSDTYKNNQYIGTWRQHNGEHKKVANWGEYRIPFSGDLDIGAGEFDVNPKYYKEGWQAFSNKR